MADSSIDWEAIERSREFRALVARRRRFVLLAGGSVVGLCVAYVLVAYLAPDALGSALGWLAGVALIAATWVVSFAYLRKSDREWEPMERAIAAPDAAGRFARSAEREPVR